jgi:hypothetical protein
MSEQSAPPVLAEVTGGLGRLTLNRPAAINALTAEMVGMLRRTLAGWSETDLVRAVLISGAGPRGLCAGGDLRAMHADAVSGGTGSLDSGPTSTGSTPNSPNTRSRWSRSSDSSVDTPAFSSEVISTAAIAANRSPCSPIHTSANSAGLTPSSLWPPALMVATAAAL